MRDSISSSSCRIRPASRAAPALWIAKRSMELLGSVGAETVSGSRLGLHRLDLAIARRRRGDERIDQLTCRARHLVHGAIYRGLMGLRRPAEAEKLAHELQRGEIDLLVSCRRVEIVERLDVSAHD